MGEQCLLSHVNDLGKQTERRGQGLSRLTRSAELSCNDGGDAGTAKRCGKVLGTLEPGFAQRSIRLRCGVRMPNEDEGRKLSSTTAGLCDGRKWHNHESGYSHGYSKRRARY